MQRTNVQSTYGSPGNNELRIVLYTAGDGGMMQDSKGEIPEHGHDIQYL